jgi:hypothetical protein
MTSARVLRFLDEFIGPNLGEGFTTFSQDEFIRMRGPFVQAFICEESLEDNSIAIIPTLYTVGAILADDRMYGTYCLNTKHVHIWKPSLEIEINDTAFAQALVETTKKNALLSFLLPIEDKAVDRALRKVQQNNRAWASLQFKAFFNMTRGALSARKDIKNAIKSFHWASINPGVVGGFPPSQDWRTVVQARLEELERRLDQQNCISLCRADAEAHAKKLKLPSIEWPSDRPTEVPPWPKKPPSLFGKLFG